jgi:hypothetical protein
LMQARRAQLVAWKPCVTGRGQRRPASTRQSRQVWGLNKQDCNLVNSGSSHQLQLNVQVVRDLGERPTNKRAGNCYSTEMINLLKPRGTLCTLRNWIAGSTSDDAGYAAALAPVRVGLGRPLAAIRRRQRKRP